MSARQPRFEVIHSDAGWFARFVATNGREIWRTSEVYTRRRGAIRALDLIDEGMYICGPFRELDEREPQP